MVDSINVERHGPGYAQIFRTRMGGLRPRFNEPPVYLVALAIIVALGLLLRLVGITQESLWADEIHSTVTARDPLWTIITKPIGNNQPLYFVVIHFWAMVFGESELALRIPSLIFGITTIVLTFFFARYFMSGRGALIASALVALAPVMIWYSQENRMYSLSAMLFLASSWSLMRLLKQPNSERAIVYGVISGLGVWNHFYLIPFIAAQVVIIGFVLVQKKDRRLGFYYTVAGILIAAPFLSRIPILLHDLDSGISNVAKGRYGEFLLDSFNIIGFQDIALGGSAIVTTLVWITIAIGASRAVRQRNMLLLFVTVTGLSLLSIAGGRIVMDLPVKLRYAVPAVPIFLTLAAYGIDGLLSIKVRWRAPMTRRAAIVATVGIVGIITIGAADSWRDQYNEPTKQQWRELALLMHTATESTDIVHAYPRPRMTPLEFYLERSDVSFAVRFSEPRCDEGRRVWVINTRQSEFLGKDAAAAIDALEGAECPRLLSRDFAGNISVDLFSYDPSSETIVIPVCGGLQPTIIGSDDSDVLSGTSGDDVISGLGGDDEISGRGGRDVICGGSGSDEISGGSENDRIFGEGGDDRLSGNSGDDMIFGGDGDDRIFGHTGDDEIHGGEGRDRLNGNDGMDMIFGGESIDILDGGAGNDSINGGGGNDRLTGGDGNDDLFGGDGNDILDGEAGLDSLDGGTGSDKLDGGSGSDVCKIDASDETPVECEQTPQVLSQL